MEREELHEEIEAHLRKLRGELTQVKRFLLAGEPDLAMAGVSRMERLVRHLSTLCRRVGDSGPVAEAQRILQEAQVTVRTPDDEETANTAVYDDGDRWWSYE